MGEPKLEAALGDHRAIVVDEEHVVCEESRKGRMYKKGAWTVAEVMVLQEAKRKDFERQSKGGLKEKHKTAQERWRWIEDVCWRLLVRRSAQQCQDKWESLIPEFKKVLDYEKKIPAGEKSYWQMLPEERKKTPKLPPNLAKEVFRALFEWYLKSKTIDQGDLLGDTSTPLPAGNVSPMAGSNGDFSGVEGDLEGTNENRTTLLKRKSQQPKSPEGIHSTQHKKQNVILAMMKCEDRKDKRQKDKLEVSLQQHRETLEMNMRRHRETLELNQKLGEGYISALCSIAEGLKQLGNALQSSSQQS